MNKKLMILISLVLLIGVVGSGVYALSYGEYESFVDLLDDIFYNNISGGNYLQGILNLIGYIVGPFFLIYFLVEGILIEINFFSKEKYNSIIALAMALIAMAGGVSLTVARYISEYGVLAILTFFAAVLVLGLSFYYRKKVREYGFFLGSRMLTHLIVHSPLILTTTIIGYYIIPSIGINPPKNVGAGISLLFLSAVIGYILHHMGFYNQQGWKKMVGWAVIGLSILGAGLIIANIGFVKNFVQNTESLFGATIGAAFGLMISVLNRHAAAHEVLSRVLETQEDLWKAYNALHEFKKIVLMNMNQGITRDDFSDSNVKLVKDVLKIDINNFFRGLRRNQPLDPEVANRLLDQIDKWIKDVERMLEYEEMKAEHTLIKEHHERNIT